MRIIEDNDGTKKTSAPKKVYGRNLPVEKVISELKDRPNLTLQDPMKPIEEMTLPELLEKGKEWNELLEQLPKTPDSIRADHLLKLFKNQTSNKPESQS